MWIRDNSAKKYISYAGPLPERLYRYRSVSPSSIDRILNFEITEEGVYLAGLRELNDPDEGRFRITFGTDYNEILAYWQRAIAKTYPEMPFAEVFLQAQSNSDRLRLSNFEIDEGAIANTRVALEQLIRVACFTTQPTNYLMWANYAKHFDDDNMSIEHGGICIEYKCGEGWRSSTLHPVKYDDSVPEICVVKQIESDLVQAIYSKSQEWRCEEEWRVTSVINSMPPFLENLTANSRVRFENAVVGIIFGMKTPDITVEKFMSFLQIKKPGLQFKRIVRDVRTFERKLVDLSV